MFFVNSDLGKKESTRTLEDVLRDKSVKMAYGVISLREFFKIIQRLNTTRAIYIPKVQRGLVWKDNDKTDFIRNCIEGDGEGVREPMPNIFLFYDEKFDELQLFDGLQRASAILGRYKNDNDISEDIMIPAALFKGTRTSAEKVFLNINHKGVKLNEFDKLAARGGEFPIDWSKEESESKLKRQFENFVQNHNKKYTNINLEISNSTESTIYELIVFSIYTFSSTIDAKELFRISPTEEKTKDFIQEWGYQLLFSIVTHHNKKEYSRKKMLEENDGLLSDFASLIEYDKFQKSFNVHKLEQLIQEISDSIKLTKEKILRNIYARKLTAKKSNKDSLCLKAIKSYSLVTSIVIYLNKKFVVERIKLTDKTCSILQLWYLRMLIEERASKQTNKIVDELFKTMKETSFTNEKELINKKIRAELETNNPDKKHDKNLWMLLYIYWDKIIGTDINVSFEIDHIFSKAKMSKINNTEITKNVNRLENLQLLRSEVNRTKSDLLPSEFLLKYPEHETELEKAILIDETINSSNTKYKLIKECSQTIEEKIIKLLEEKGEDKKSRLVESIKDKFSSFISTRKDIIIDTLEKKLSLNN